MEELTIRCLPDLHADGPTQMAADEVMLRSATKGIASLRFYTWSQATLSLGYFQREAGRHDNPLLSGLPFVRRPTGGHALVHHHELTYALALPGGISQKSGSWLRMHEVIAAALLELGVQAEQQGSQPREASTSYLCFHHRTAGDLVIGAAKIAGSAQRRQHGAILQHGAVLLATSPFTPSLPGIRELTGVESDPLQLCIAIGTQAQRSLGWHFLLEDWTPVESADIQELAASRYRADSWNRKR